jgi:MFS family permease
MPQISLYFAAEAVTVLGWNRLSDHIGRKPVFLSGTLGTAISITLFGLSRSFSVLALWCVARHTVPPVGTMPLANLEIIAAS